MYRNKKGTGVYIKMSFKDYIKDKSIYILALLFVVVTSEILLIPFNIHKFVKIYIKVIPVVMFFICFFIEYYRKNKYYTNLKNKIEELDEKYLISEIIEASDFSESKILKEVLQETGKSMLENVNNYKHLTEEYKEYIELWIHEVKLPIATGKMIIENNKSKVTESIDEELDKIENYVEQALFYARSNVPEKDYYIKKQSLKEIINTAILKNKRSLLQNKVKLDLHELEGQVYTDSKWCTFIINQIIQNAVKYTKTENKKIEIYDVDNKENTILYIKDNGIGIKESEISRVFEKGFTGTNGRKTGQKSTGMGLYLCKKLCDKLGLKIKLNSNENLGTEVKIKFPKSSFIQDVIN